MGRGGVWKSEQGKWGERCRNVVDVFHGWPQSKNIKRTKWNTQVTCRVCVSSCQACRRPAPVTWHSHQVDLSSPGMAADCHLITTTHFVIKATLALFYQSILSKHLLNILLQNVHTVYTFKTALKMILFNVDTGTQRQTFCHCWHPHPCHRVQELPDYYYYKTPDKQASRLAEENHRNFSQTIYIFHQSKSVIICQSQGLPFMTIIYNINFSNKSLHMHTFYFEISHCLGEMRRNLSHFSVFGQRYTIHSLQQTILIYCACQEQKPTNKKVNKYVHT